MSERFTTPWVWAKWRSIAKRESLWALFVAPKDNIRYLAPVVPPLERPIYDSGNKLGSQNRIGGPQENYI